MTWRQVVDTDLEYVEWILFESDMVLSQELRAALEEAIEDFLPIVEDDTKWKDD